MSMNDNNTKYANSHPKLMASGVSLVNLLREAAETGKERAVKLPDGKICAKVSVGRYKYLLDLERETIEKQPEEFLKALDRIRAPGNVSIKLTLEGGREVITGFQENYCQLAQSRPMNARLCLVLRCYSQKKNGSKRQTGALHVVYYDHDFEARTQSYDDYLGPLKIGASREEYDAAVSEVRELTRNPILLIYGDESETLKEYVSSIMGIGIDFEECWQGYVFKDDAPGRNRESLKGVLKFKRGKARFADKSAIYSAALKAQFARKLELSEILAEFDKVVQSTGPLKLIFSFEAEMDLKSLLGMNLNRDGIIEVVIKQYTESFGARYFRSCMFRSKFSLGCGGNSVEELTAFLRSLGYDKE